MSEKYYNLYLEIKRSIFIFYVEEKDDQNNSKINYKFDVPAIGIEDNKISDFENFFDTIKKNIYIAEQNQKRTFKEIVLILDYFNTSFVNLTGYKKLNGSQILRENITYILNTLKFYVDEIESKKTILHIFNSKFSLDYKKIENPPIGLFGDFYSHELSFSLIDKNDYKNLQNLFEKCNLRIKKILLKSFIKGVFLSEKYLDLDTFYFIEVDTNSSRVFYFENNCLKFEQSFKFGFDIILRDISKITLLKKEFIEKILEQVEFDENISDEELVEKELFEDGNYKKIKKKLIFEIAKARIVETLELIIFKNINLKHYNKTSKTVFFQFNEAFNFKSIRETYKATLFQKGIIDTRYLDELSHDNTVDTANKLVHFGWKKEVIPFTKTKKSLIARFFSAIFE
jgi:cell division protein FtsA